MAITFYTTIDSDSVRPYMPDVPVLLPASSWARKGLKAPKLPAHITHTAADSGGFVASFRHGGEYQYSPQDYVQWLHTFTPRWAAMMDLCCEPEIVGKNDGVVRDRQRRTTQNARMMWQDYRRTPWAWVPTVQGWDVADYQHHAQELRPLVDEMADYYGSGSDFRVGIGTLCHRASTEMIRTVCYTVAGELPNIPLHLWGVKLNALKSSLALPETVMSVDSAAWDGLAGSRDRREWEAYRDAGSGTQCEFSYHVALPRYLAKVEAALATPKQLSLRWEARS